MSDRKRTRASLAFRRDYLARQAHLHDLRGNANLLSEETVKSTRRMVRLAHECQDAGIQTLLQLHEQEVKLENTEQHLGSINETLSVAHQDLGKLEYGEELEKRDDWRCWMCYWCCKCYKCRNLEDESPNPRPTTIDKTPNSTSSAADEVQTRNENKAPQKPKKKTSILDVKVHKRKGSLIGRITNDSKEEEMESHLQEVSSVVGSLKMVAQDVGVNLTRSNKQIDRISEKVSRGQRKLSWAKARAEKLQNS